jgi:hypothetical protein
MPSTTPAGYQTNRNAIVSLILAILNEPFFNIRHRSRIFIIDGLDSCAASYNAFPFLSP